MHRAHHALSPVIKFGVRHLNKKEGVDKPTELLAKLDYPVCFQ